MLEWRLEVSLIGIVFEKEENFIYLIFNTTS